MGLANAQKSDELIVILGATTPSAVRKVIKPKTAYGAKEAVYVVVRVLFSGCYEC